MLNILNEYSVIDQQSEDYISLYFVYGTLAHHRVILSLISYNIVRHCKDIH